MSFTTSGLQLFICTKRVCVAQQQEETTHAIKSNFWFPNRGDDRDLPIELK